MAITVTPNLTLIDDCDDNTGWSGGNDVAIDYLQGSGCLGDAVSITTSVLYSYTISSTNMANQHIFIWVKVNGQVDTQANGGYRVYASDGTNFSYWYAGGNDTHPSGWSCLAVDINAARDSGSGTLNTGAITSVGIQFKTLTATRTVGKEVVENVFWDVVRYGTGLTITSGATDGIDWADISGEDNNTSNKYGVITKGITTGIYEIQGNLIFGDASGTGSVDFDDTGEILAFKNSSYYSSTFNQINIVGNGTGTTNFVMGDKVGGQGVSGCTIKSVGTKVYSFDATDTDVDILRLYGCVLDNAGTIDLPPTTANREVITSTFANSGEVTADTCTMQYCNFVSSDDNALSIDSASHNVSDCVFINCPDAVYIDTANTYTFDNLTFYNCTYNIENAASGTNTDTYSESNQDGTTDLNATTTGVGQSFTGDGNVLSNVELHLSKTLSPTGSAYAKVYAHSGTFGTSSIPTGTALATSEALDVSTLTASLVLTRLNFTGDDNITLTNTVKYVVTLEYGSGDASNYVSAGNDGSSPSHGGNLSTYTGSWSDDDTKDLCFYLRTGGIVVVNATNGANPITSRETATIEGSTTINNTVTLFVHVQDGAQGDVETARVSIRNSSTNVEISQGETNSSGDYTDATYNYAGDVDVIIRVRRSSTGTTRYYNYLASATIGSAGLSHTATLIEDSIVAS